MAAAAKTSAYSLVLVGVVVPTIPVELAAVALL